MSTHISDFFDSEEILNRLYGIGTPVVAIFICFIVSAIIAFQDTQTLTKQEKLICKLNFILLAVAIVLCFLFLPIGILMIFAFFGYSIYTFHIFSVSQTSRSDNKILKTKDFALQLANSRAKQAEQESLIIQLQQQMEDLRQLQNTAEPDAQQGAPHLSGSGASPPTDPGGGEALQGL